MVDNQVHIVIESEMWELDNQIFAPVPTFLSENLQRFKISEIHCIIFTESK